MKNLKTVDLEQKVETRFCAWVVEEKNLYWFDVLWGNNGSGNGWIGLVPYGLEQSEKSYRDNVSNYGKDDFIVLPYSDNYIVVDGELYEKSAYEVGTVGYWLDKMDEPERSQALENAVNPRCKFKGLDHPVGSIADAINFGSLWEKTPTTQGWNYWNDLRIKYSEKEDYPF